MTKECCANCIYLKKASVDKLTGEKIVARCSKLAFVFKYEDNRNDKLFSTMHYRCVNYTRKPVKGSRFTVLK